MSYIIDDPTTFIDSGFSTVVNVTIDGNITTLDNYGFLKNSETVTWAMNKNQPTSYQIRYPPTLLSNTQGFFTSNNDPSDLTGYFLEAPNTRIVRSNPAPGQYLSVRDAISSISGSSLLNPFTVWVQPGTFIETDFSPITIPQGVFITGFGVGETVLVDHSFSVTAAANPGVFGINNATLKRVNHSTSNAFLSFSSNRTLGLILDSEFEDWKNLFNVTASLGSLLRVGKVSTSANSTIYPNIVANIAYTTINTGSNVEINKSSFILDSSSTPFLMFGDASTPSGGGFSLRNCDFNATGFSDRDFVNAPSFRRMILKSLNVSGYSNILTISGIGLNVDSNNAIMNFSDVITPDAQILIQDNPNFGASYTFKDSVMANYNASFIGNKTDLNKVFINNKTARLSITNLDDCREFHFRDIPTFEDFTSPNFPYFDVPYTLITTGTANITNSSPTLTNSSIVNGFGTFSLQATNDAMIWSPAISSFGVSFSGVQQIKVGAGIAVFDPVGAGNTTLMIGLGDSNNLTSLTTNNIATSNGIYFSYSPSTALYPNNFNCVYKVNNNVSVTDSTIPVSNGVYYNLDFEYKRNDQAAITNFYINDVLVSNISTTVFQNSRLYPMIKYFSNNGSGAWSVDYFDMSVRINR